jgi:hypothetical protein
VPIAAASAQSVASEATALDSAGISASAGAHILASVAAGLGGTALVATASGVDSRIADANVQLDGTTIVAAVVAPVVVSLNVDLAGSTARQRLGPC